MVGQHLWADADRAIFSEGGQLNQRLISKVRIDLTQLGRDLGRRQSPLLKTVPRLVVSEAAQENFRYGRPWRIEANLENCFDDCILFKFRRNRVLAFCHATPTPFFIGHSVLHQTPLLSNPHLRAAIQEMAKAVKGSGMENQKTRR
jgi:hypothetical protein